MENLKHLYRLFLPGKNDSTDEIWQTDVASIFRPQQRSFDCGVSCALMVHKLLKASILSAEMNSLMEKTAPCWTIEIFVALRSCGVEARMYTSYKGINGSHFVNFEWYQKYTKDIPTDGAIDTGIISSAFDIAERRGWTVVEKALELSEINVLLELGYVAILLVDNNILKGHCARYDRECDVTYYLDPATSEAEVKRVSYSTLQMAQSHQGTDRDVIIVDPPSDSSSFLTDLRSTKDVP